MQERSPCDAPVVGEVQVKQLDGEQEVSIAAAALECNARLKYPFLAMPSCRPVAGPRGQREEGQRGILRALGR